MASPTRSPGQSGRSGRLPARVYWFRRFLVLGTALALVFATARMLTGSDGADPQGAAQNVVGVQSPGPATTTPRPTATSTARTTARPKASATPTAPAQPDGPCAANEVTVSPVEGTAAAGREVALVLQLTGIRAACTFQVSASSVVAKVSSGKGKVWSTQECPSSIAPAAVVVRSAAPTSIQVAWSGRGSDSTCSRTTAWAMPGTYQVLAAAIGSEPSTASLRLTVPERPVVIRTVQPKPTKKPRTGQSSSPVTPNTGP